MASLLRAPLLGSALRPATSARVLAPPPAAKGKKGNMMHVEVRAGGRGREGSAGGRITGWRIWHGFDDWFLVKKNAKSGFLVCYEGTWRWQRAHEE